MFSIAAITVIFFLNSALCAAAYATSPAATVFVTSYLERGSTSTEPRPEQLKDRISVFGAPGEYEPATFSIRSETELKGVSVALRDDLVSKKGDIIPKSAVVIRLIDPFESWTNKKIESYLLSRSSVNIAAKTTRRFWITVHVPDDAKPGLYRSTISIGKPVTGLGPDLGTLETFQVLTYEINVLPITLLSAKDTGMAFFMYNATCRFPEELATEEYQTKVFEDMREHGMTTVTAYIYPPLVDGKFSLTRQTERHLAFAQTMNMLKKTDLVAPGVPIVWLGMGSDPALWKLVLDEGLRSNWPEIAYYGVDEPGEEERNHQVRESMKGINAFRAKYPEYGLRITTALGSSRGIQTVGHHYDLWIGCMAQRTGESGMINQAKMHSKELWTYDCMAAPVDAETDRYYFGVWAWVSGVKGCAHWAYFAQPHLSYVYADKDEIIPTIGWEAVREGIDDYRYLATLKQLADRARAAGEADLAKGADKIFEEVKEMVTMDNYGKAYHKARSVTGDNLADAYNRPRIEPGLSIDSYDQMRLKASIEIEKLAASVR